MTRAPHLAAVALLAACGRTVTAPPDDAADVADAGDAAVDRPDANRSVTPRFEPWDAGAPLCSADGWCWESPSPVGGEIVSVSSSAPDDGWALTADGALLHASSRGLTALRAHAYDPAATAGAVFSAGPDDVWVSVRGALLHWDGRSMRRVTFYDGFNEPTLVWGRGAGDVWLAGSAGDALHFDGERWEPRPIGTSADVVALTGGAEREVRALDARGAVWRWRDGAWARGEGVAREAFRSPWVLAADDAWACDDGAALHWNGRAWRREVIDGAPASQRCAVWSDGADVWFSDGLTVRRRDADGRWSYEPDALFVTAAGGAPSNVWVGRSDGVVQRLMAGQWVGVTRTRPRFDVTRVAGDDDATLRAITVATVMGFDGAGWFEAAAPTRYYELHGVWPRGAGDTWLAGLVRQGARDAGRASLWNRTDGERFVLDAPSPLRAVAASADDDAWAVGDGGAAWRFDGAAWSRVETGVTEKLADVWVGSRDAAWAVGDRVALRWDGRAWWRAPLPVDVSLARVHAVSIDDAWAVGRGASRSYALHWDGVAWRVDSAGLPEGYEARGVWASRAGAWLAGTTVLRRDARVSSAESLGAEVTPRAVWGTRDGAVRVGGSSAAIFVRRAR